MSFNTGLSGIQAANTELDAIGNNIANASTAGFKESSVGFGAMFAANSFGVSALATGIGVNTLSVAQQFNQGSITITGNQLDLAISGNGFFVVKSPLGTDYTRNGQFQVDSAGFINYNGAQLQGWGVNPTTGTIEVGKLTSLQVDNSLLAPRPSDYNGGATIVQVNLNSTNTVPVVAFTPANPSSYNSTTSTQLYDSLGNVLTMNVYFVNTSTAGSWSEYTSVSNADGTNVQWMDSTGAFTAAAVPAAATSTMAFNGSGVLISGGTIPAGTGFTSTLGANDLKLSLDLNGTTQYGTSFAVNNVIQPGYAASVMTQLSVNTAGVISAQFSNGQSQNLGQVALANFNDTQGLQSAGGNLWSQTFTSGNATYNSPGSSNVGSIQSQALEASNVDLTTQLVDLITAQRYYQANSQTLKVEEQVQQALNNL